MKVYIIKEENWSEFDTKDCKLYSVYSNLKSADNAYREIIKNIKDTNIIEDDNFEENHNLDEDDKRIVRQWNFSILNQEFEESICFCVQVYELEVYDSFTKDDLNEVIEFNQIN